jgi:hypothetical protein
MRTHTRFQDRLSNRPRTAACRHAAEQQAAKAAPAPASSGDALPAQHTAFRTRPTMAPPERRAGTHLVRHQLAARVKDRPAAVRVAGHAHLRQQLRVLAAVQRQRRARLRSKGAVRVILPYFRPAQRQQLRGLAAVQRQRRARLRH